MKRVDLRAEIIGELERLETTVSNQPVFEEIRTLVIEQIRDLRLKLEKHITESGNFEKSE